MLTIKVAILVCDYRSFAIIWVFRRPAAGWAGRICQKAVVWFNTWNMSEQRPVSLVFTTKAAKMLSERKWLPPSLHGQTPEPMGSQEQIRFHELQSGCLRGWSTSKSHTLIWVNSSDLTLLENWWELESQGTSKRLDNLQVLVII